MDGKDTKLQGGFEAAWAGGARTQRGGEEGWWRPRKDQQQPECPVARRLLNPTWHIHR